MWRCRCGETNLEADGRCRSCEGLRRAAERADMEYRPPKRWKSVQVGFFGMGIEDPRGGGVDEPRLTEAELEAYYRDADRRNRLGWIGSNHQSELVCEAGTGLMESYLRLPHDQDNTNVNKWLPKWAEGIKANPAYLFDAVRFAERAVNSLLERRRRWKAA